MKVVEPKEGQIVDIKKNNVNTPDKVIIPFIEGDGIGIDICKVSLQTIDAAVEKAYNGKRKIIWFEIFAGEKAVQMYGKALPDETLLLIEKYKIALKGPLTTPIGGGMRSLNVFLRQHFDLYACVRPVKYFKGIVAPVAHPELMDVVIFRENTEDVYAGIEWEKGSQEAIDLINFIKDKYHTSIREDSGIGIKPISEFCTKRLVRKAIEYAIKYKRKSVTLVHKGNIMKYTEGAFSKWGYEVAEEEFKDFIITESELEKQFNGIQPANKIVIKDRIADNMFQQILTKANEYQVIATPNLNGDYLSDACAAQVGGLGIAPGANIGDSIAIFEATHGSAPKHANQDKANPGSLMLSGQMMLEFLGWKEAAELLGKGIQNTILQKKVTYDFARTLENVEPIKTSEFAQAIIQNINQL